MNESWLSWRVCVHVVFIWTHVQYEILWPCGLTIIEPQSCQQCHASILVASPEQCAGWCNKRDLWGSPKGNNHRDSCLMNMVARATHTQNSLEIDSRGNSYQTHHAECSRWHSLYMGMHHPAEKMLCPLAVHSEWLEWPHFAFTAGITGLWFPPQKLVQDTLACWLHTTQCSLQMECHETWYGKMLWEWTPPPPPCCTPSCTLFTWPQTPVVPMSSH